MPEETNALHRIVHDLDANLLVEAGAGTGKTYALVSRVVALVKAGIRMENIVAITFTEAAAAELADRVRSRMEQLLDESHPDNAGDMLYQDMTDAQRGLIGQAISELDQASIQTIHSFAAQLLRQRPMNVGLPPGWAQWDELAAGEAFAERWSEWLEWALGSEGEDAAALAPTLRHLLRAGIGISHWSDLAGAIVGLYDVFSAGAGLSTPDLRLLSEETIAALEELTEDCPDESHPLYGQLSGAIATARSVLAACDDPLEAGSALEQGAAMMPSSGSGSRSKWGDRTPTEIRALFREVGGAFQQAVRSAAILPLLEQLRRSFGEEYPGQRKADGVATFDDLLVLARDLMLDDGARRHFQNRYTHLLIDEFQDTDPLQAEIGFYLAAAEGVDVKQQDWHTLPLEPGRLFIVGDAKQSIYRFRGADLGVTQKVKNGGRLESLTLSENRRSQEPVLEWVNRVFGGLMGDGSDVQAEYVPLERHEGIQSAGVDAAVRVFGGPEGDAAADDIRRTQARHIANMLVAYTTDGNTRLHVYDKVARSPRPARLGDVCVLIPTRTGLGILERGLEDAGIPYRIEGGSLLFNAQEVQDLLNCLRAIDDPSDAVAVAAALRSPAFACSDVDLLDWREANGSWNYLETPMPDAPAPVAAGMAKLREYHEMRHSVPVARLISKFIRERRLEELDLAEYRPREVWRRRQFLVEQARNLASVHTGRDGQAPWNLHQFLLWADLQQEERSRITELPVPETDDDAVRIMTIHAAKGLEFPIVILLGLDHVPRSRHPAALFDADANTVEISIGSASGGTVMRTPGYQARADLEDEHAAAEEVRLAYVAATRARDHLLVSLYHKPNSAGEPPNNTIGAILDLQDDPVQSRVLVDADAELTMASPAADTDGMALEYDRDGWQKERDLSFRHRRRPQAVTATWLAQRAGYDAGAATVSATEEGAIEDKEAEPDAEQPWRTGRGGTAFGSALHGVLQDAVGRVLLQLHHGDGEPPSDLLEQLDGIIDSIAGQHADHEDVLGRTDDIIAQARQAIRNEAVTAAFRAKRLWPEIPVAAPMQTNGDTVVIEGIIDLLYLDHDDRLVILDYKSDVVENEGAVMAKLDHYRWQGAAYAAAVERATGMTVKEVQFLFVYRDEMRSVENFRELVEQLGDLVG